jgi:hypothetical protein
MILDTRKEWLQAAIAGGHITYIKFSNFEEVKFVARGAFGEVSCAYWNTAEKIVALKSIYINSLTEIEDSFEEFVREVNFIHILINLIFF